MEQANPLPTFSVTIIFSFGYSSMITSFKSLLATKRTSMGVLTLDNPCRMVFKCAVTLPTGITTDINGEVLIGRMLSF